MNNDELKKKIADIIYHTGCTGACCECDYSKHSDADTYCKAMLKASALIAAGIGDVSELKKHRILVKSVSIPNDENFYIVPQTEIDIKQLYNGEEVEQIVKERDKYKHRAEVAERAVYNLAYGEWQREGARRAICEKYAPSTARDYLDRAEKELAEEWKDD